MKLVCKYCGYCVEYENGTGWFAGYAQKLHQHILDEHVRLTAVERRDGEGQLEEIRYGAYVDPGYSGELHLTASDMLKVGIEDRLKPPPYVYVEPTEPTIKSDS